MTTKAEEAWILWNQPEPQNTFDKGYTAGMYEERAKARDLLQRAKDLLSEEVIRHEAISAATTEEEREQLRIRTGWTDRARIYLEDAE